MPTSIVILGGGFGILAAANELNNLSKDLKIIVIGKKDWFMMDLVKLWIIKGTRTFETSKRNLDSINKKGINFINDEIIAIDSNKKIVKTKNSQINYDYLIISLS